MWRLDDPQGAEVGKIKYEVVPYVRGKLLDIGAGPYRIFPYAVTVDDGNHAQQFGWQYKPDVMADATEMPIFADGSFDSVFSSHLLEHIEDTEKALREWWRVLRQDGYLVLYLPHKDLYPNIGEHGANPDHKHDFGPGDIRKIMKRVGSWEIVVDEVRDADYGEGSSMNEYSFLQVYRKKKKGHRTAPKRPNKTAMVVRYGGFGDMIQASSILPHLKKQGYHVIFNTTPTGQGVLKNDPNIDEFWIQDTNQVPNEELNNYWAAMERKWDKFVNLSATVEHSLLTVVQIPGHHWPQAARHRMCNVNYLELTHDVAGVDQDYYPKFYPTQEEQKWARTERAKIGGDLVVCISLAGSSVHKSYPHTDSLIARFLVSYPESRIILLGNDMSKMLEAGWEDEPRVLCRSGVWNIRQSLTFVNEQADLIIGPETGVLNSAGMEDVPKVCYLSHSSKENLTKHWVNTTAIEPPPSVECYPCHQMHYNFDYCKRDEQTGTALCQARIPVDVVWGACLGALKKSGALEKAKEAS